MYRKILSLIGMTALCVACGSAYGQPSGGGGGGGAAGGGVGVVQAGDCVPGNEQVAFFVDSNYEGQCIIRAEGDYANADAIGLPDNSVSSIKVGANAQAVLCVDGNFGGVCETLTADDPDLNDNSVGSEQTSSARVQPRGA